jgi:molybdopterin converting factor small subunit
MREYISEGGATNRAELDLPAGSTIGDVVAALGAPVHQVFAVLLDGGQASLDEEVQDGSEVTLMPPFTGGY